MKLDLFDDIDGLVLRERENSLAEAHTRQNMNVSGETTAFPACTPLAMAYVPFQQWGDTKSAEDALQCGTLFSDLVFPFERGGDCE